MSLRVTISADFFASHFASCSSIFHHPPRIVFPNHTPDRITPLPRNLSPFHCPNDVQLSLGSPWSGVCQSLLPYHPMPSHFVQQWWAYVSLFLCMWTLLLRSFLESLNFSLFLILSDPGSLVWVTCTSLSISLAFGSYLPLHTVEIAHLPSPRVTRFNR